MRPTSHSPTPHTIHQLPISKWEEGGNNKNNTTTTSNSSNSINNNNNDNNNSSYLPRECDFRDDSGAPQAFREPPLTPAAIINARQAANQKAGESGQVH